MSNEHERFYTTVPMVGTIPENSSGGGGTGLQPVVCGKVAAACTDRIGGAGVVTHGVVVDAQSDALREENERLRNEYIKNSESHVVSNLRSIADEQAEQITRLLELLNAWTELAREHLDTELAGLTFAALRDAGHG